MKPGWLQLHRRSGRRQHGREDQVAWRKHPCWNRKDIPGVGRFAMVADPQGMVFYIMRGDGSQDSQAFHVTAPGHCGWNELVTSDHKAALAFYGELFNWQK